MIRPMAHWRTRLCIVLNLSVMIGSTAGASAIPSYTVTDLGVGSPTLSSPTGADATLTAPDGRTVYGFARTDNSASDPNALFAKFPAFTDAPTWASMTYGNPKFAYSEFSGGAFLNENGVFAATKIVGVEGHIQASGSSVLTARQQPDGSFGPLSYLWGTPDNRYSGGQVATVLDLNNNNQLLGISSPANFSYFGARTFVLDDLNTGQLTSLDQLLPGLSIQYGGPMALDDQGRILTYGASADTGWTTHAYLLTPAGLTSDPIATPEPSALATLAIAAAGLSIRRRFQR